MSKSNSLNWVCLTPTRNESWIIKQFVAAAELWASHIIVADQGSTDGTLQQLQSMPMVEVVTNSPPAYDERHRQLLLLERARRISGRRILIALDADEALSSNCVSSKEWERINEAPLGTVLRFRWVNILPGFQKAWIPPGYSRFGFVDDGTEHAGKRIHNPRLPCPPGAPTIDLNEIVVLHFQYVAWERMISKQRWYMAWECATHRQKRPLQIFREYHHMSGGWEKDEIHAVKPEWLAGYDLAGIDYRSLESEPVTWWDKEIIQMLRKHGPHHFRKMAIWNQDWNAVARSIGLNGIDLADPRSAFEKLAHAILAATQNHRSNYGRTRL